jgi:hypothetical protein
MGNDSFYNCDFGVVVVVGTVCGLSPPTITTDIGT